jgi:hypothetical protein
MARQFTALRVVGTIFKILAWIALILGLLAAVGGLFFGFTLGDQIGLPGPDLGGPLAGIAVFVVSVVLAIVNFLLWYAAGEAVYVFLSIEENTRRSAYFVQQQFSAPEASYQPPSPSQDYEQY